jgi:protein lifeguard
LYDEFRIYFLDPNQQAYYGQSPYPPQQPAFQQQPMYPTQPGFPPQQGFQQPYNPAYPHQMPSFRPQPPYMDPEDPDAKNFDFNDESIRKGFIKKVYSILCVQLTVTLGIIALFVFHEPTQKYIKHHQWMMWVALGFLFVMMLVLACCESVRRTSPMNFICLGLYTLAQGFILGVISSIHDPEIVMMAVGLTAVVCLGLTIFAFQTKWDFTVSFENSRNDQTC